jgi:hypothetical protein
MNISFEISIFIEHEQTMLANFQSAAPCVISTYTLPLRAELLLVDDFPIMAQGALL